MKCTLRKAATSITTHTLVGVGDGPYPMKHGNCFSIKCGGDKEYRVVNFNYENLVHLLKEKLIEWPITVLVFWEGSAGESRTAMIHDHRIPDNYYQDFFCETCCPRDYLPIPQRLRIQRDLESGRVREIEVPSMDGKGKMIISTRKVNGSPTKLKDGWTMEEDKNAPEVLSGVEMEKELQTIMSQPMESDTFAEMVGPVSTKDATWDDWLKEVQKIAMDPPYNFPADMEWNLFREYYDDGDNPKEAVENEFDKAMTED